MADRQADEQVVSIALGRVLSNPWDMPKTLDDSMTVFAENVKK